MASELQEAIEIVADYFPDALIEIAEVCKAGNRQHNGIGSILFWDRSKSAEHFTKGIRHWTRRGTRDTDGTLHTGKAAWRAMADVQLEREASGQPKPPAVLRAPAPFPGSIVPEGFAVAYLRDVAESDDPAPHDGRPPNPVSQVTGD